MSCAVMAAGAAKIKGGMHAKDGKLLSEVQRGYMLRDRVLRPAMVVVGKGTGAEESK
jgi:molecular chaperone GrpE (heat shock protein)